MASPAIQLPFQTEYDSKLTNDGSIDPLALYSISENLATRLCPGVRERMSNPRYLTLTAISHAVCASFDDDTVANDDAGTPPHLVFEWYVVEGLVRSAGDTLNLRGLPGRDKAGRVVALGLGLSSTRYLKVASVFGFHGIYRPLAKQLELEIGGGLGPFGLELLDIWQRENDLPGFVGGSQGEGARIRDILREAITKGLDKGEVAHAKSWRHWELFSKYLQHQKFGKAEARAIFNRIIETETSLRRPLIEFLGSADGQVIASGKHASERSFHEMLRKKCGKELATILDAIMAYENFSRLVQNGFDECLKNLCEALRAVEINELATLKSIILAAAGTPSAFQDAADKIAAIDPELARRFTQTFHTFSETMTEAAWIQNLFEHHRLNQERKPPHGKRPWVLTNPKTNAMHIQPNYRRNYTPKFDGSYVNFYRMVPLQSFLTRMGVVNG